MRNKLKSAFELAMERLARADARDGTAGPPTLTADQKKRIAAVRLEYEAKLAERRILHDSALAATADPEEIQRLEADDRRDREYLVSLRERKIRAIHAEKG